MPGASAVRAKGASRPGSEQALLALGHIRRWRPGAAQLAAQDFAHQFASGLLLWKEFFLDELAILTMHADQLPFVIVQPHILAFFQRAQYSRVAQPADAGG